MRNDIKLNFTTLVLLNQFSFYGIKYYLCANRIGCIRLAFYVCQDGLGKKASSRERQNAEHFKKY